MARPVSALTAPAPLDSGVGYDGPHLLRRFTLPPAAECHPTNRNATEPGLAWLIGAHHKTGSTFNLKLASRIGAERLS